MRQAQIRGIKRGRRVITTRRDDQADRSPDLVQRDFTATGPNQLWVTDLTYVPTWSGVAYVCFIVEAFSRMIVGWRVATTMRTEIILDALEMARWSRGTALEVLRCHSDAGSQFTSIRYGERLDEIGAEPSIGSVGDFFDNALAEAVNALYKTGLIRGPGTRTVADRRRRRTGHPRLGPLAQQRTAARLPERRAAGQSSRRPTLPNKPTSYWLESNNPSLHQTQGESLEASMTATST